MSVIKSYFGCIIDARKGRGNHLEKIAYIATHKKGTTYWIIEDVSNRNFIEMSREGALGFLRKASDYIIKGEIVTNV